MAENKLAKDIVSKTDQMKGRRIVFESSWQEIADVMLTSREFLAQHNPGEKRQTKIFDSTAPLALEHLAGQLQGICTSSAIKWHGLRAEDESLDEDQDAQVYLDKCTTSMYGQFNSAASKFNSSAHELYLDMCGFGTGVMFVEKRRSSPGVSYTSVPLSECYIEENEEGLVDTLHRETKMTARNMYARFKDKVSDQVKRDAKTNPNAVHTVIHAVSPRTDFMEGVSREYKNNMPFRSCFIERETLTTLDEGGFRSFPYMVVRFGKRSGEQYGTGPGWIALADTKMANEMQKVIIQAAQVSIYPPMQMPNDGFLAPLKLGPAKINYYRAGTPADERISPIQTDANPRIGLDMLSAIRQSIRSAFYVDWLNLPEDGPQMTAAEIYQRRDERMRLLSPLLGRIETEFLGPLIERTFDLMNEQGLLPEPPESIAGKAVKIEYLSPLAQAQKAIEIDAIQQVAMAVQGFAAYDPVLTDILKGEDIIRAVARIRGMPLKYLNDNRYMKASRERFAQQQQQQQMAAMAPDVAGAAKDGAQAGKMLQDMGILGQA